MTTRSHRTGFVLIAEFKVVKGVRLLLVGLGLLKLMHAEIATLFYRLIEALHLNADSRIMHVLNVDALRLERRIGGPSFDVHELPASSHVFSLSVPLVGG